MSKKSAKNNRLITLRKDADLTQAELAGKLGIKQSMVSQCETGKKDFSKRIKIKAAKFFNVTVEYLFYEEYYTPSCQDSLTIEDKLIEKDREGITFR